MSNFQGIRVALRLMAVAALSMLVVVGASAQTIRYVHTDGLGSVVLTTDKDRNIVERSEYEPYGRLLNRSLTDGPGYTGHIMDAATGLTYMQQRYYEPDIGVFLSVDPVSPRSSGDNFNRYAYAGNNPYRFIDPDGRELGIAFKVVNEATNGGPIVPPPRSPKDWLGPAIGGALGVLFAPAIVYGGAELGLAALANPATSNAVGLAAADIFAGDALGGASLTVVAAGSVKLLDEVTEVYGPYHRLGDSAEAVQSIRASGELRGNPPRNFFQSDIAKVKAYDGPLPAGSKGFEFTTPVAPDLNTVPGKPLWSTKNPGVEERNGQAVIKCTVTGSEGC